MLKNAKRIAYLRTYFNGEVAAAVGVRESREDNFSVTNESGSTTMVSPAVLETAERRRHISSLVVLEEFPVKRPIDRLGGASVFYASTASVFYASTGRQTSLFHKLDNGRWAAGASPRESSAGFSLDAAVRFYGIDEETIVPLYENPPERN